MKKNMHWGYSGDYDYYGGGWATKQSNTWGSKLNCHTGNPLVFTTDDGIEVYAGGTSRNGAWYRMSPLPDLAIGPKQVIGSKKEGTTVPDGFSCAEHISVSKVPMVRIDLPDYDIPQDVGREFWVALVEDIRRAGYKRISTQCVGGHGRTGVQLAILYHMLVGGDYADANALIKHVRGLYCHHAVETKSQQQYVTVVTPCPMIAHRVDTAGTSAAQQQGTHSVTGSGHPVHGLQTITHTSTGGGSGQHASRWQ